jgi:hypothetical protein
MIAAVDLASYASSVGCGSLGETSIVREKKEGVG